jgi:DNA polymerase III delta subunit
MTISDVKKQIQEHAVDSLYLFVGEEIGIMNIYIDMISNEFETVINTASITSIYRTLTGKSLFNTGKNVLYIIREDPAFLSNDSYWNEIIPILKLKNITIIFKYREISKSHKIYKALGNNIVIFEKLSSNVLRKYIQDAIDVPVSYCDYLIDVCDHDYSRIMLEVDKVIRLSDACSIKNKEALEIINESGLIYTVVDGNVYDLIDDILFGNKQDVLYSLQKCKLRGDNQMYVLSILHNVAKSVLQLQLCDKKDVQKITGLTAFQIKNAKKYVNARTNEQLIRIIKIVKYCEESIKNGTLCFDNVLDYLIISSM